MSCTHDCGCTPEIRDARTDEWVQIAPESARPATLTPEQPVKAPGQGGDVCAPQEPVLPRRIEPGDFEVERVAATIHAAVTAAQAINIEAVYRSTGLSLSGGSHDFANIAWDAARAVVRGFDVRLIEDAPTPVDPDAAVIEAIITAYRRSPECSTDSVFGEAMLDHLRAQGFDVTARAEQ